MERGEVVLKKKRRLVVREVQMGTLGKNMMKKVIE